MFETQSNQLLPITSLYERNGHVRNLEGRIRKHTKTISSFGERRNLETVFSAFCLKQGLSQ
jgi:NADH dehydrogenase/NADH:ubiquinone oxidoreductase subunit G